MSPELARWRTPVVVGVVAAVIVGLLYLVGVTHPPAPPAIGTDRLGPESGQLVEVYLAQSAAGLDGARDGARWALISLRAGVDDDTAWSVMTGVTPSQVAFHVAIPQVATPTLLVPVTDIRRSLDIARDRGVAEVGAGVMGTDSATAGSDAARPASVARVVAHRLASGCACVVAMVVRGSPAMLQQIAGRPQVRAVEVLPADAAGGRFAVVPLLPETTGRVGPQIDTGPVPPA